MPSPTHYRAELETVLSVDLTFENSSWFIHIVSFPTTYASVRCFPGPPELEKAKKWALGLAQWQIEDQNLGVPVPEKLNWEAVEPCLTNLMAGATSDQNRAYRSELP